MRSSTPIRNPELGSEAIMTRRAWWLVILNVLIPGSAQSLAGNKRFGRFALGATLTLWFLVIAVVLLFFFARSFLLAMLPNSVTLMVLAVLLAFYAVLWFILSADTLRLVRFVRARPGTRIFIAVVGIFAMLGVTGTAAYGSFIASGASEFVGKVFRTGPNVPPIDGRYNILLLGGDAGPDREGLRPDSITVVSIDAETGQAVTIGLPRDMLDVPFVAGSPLAEKYPKGYGAIDGCEVSACKLNSIYTEVELRSPQLYPNAKAESSSPGIEGMRDAAEAITGLTIQYYGLIDMQGFAELIDELGGVTVDVKEDVPIHADDTFTTVAEWIRAGVQKLDGAHALWFARSRHGSSDFARMARQRQLEEAILAQFTPAAVLTKFQGLAAVGSQVVRTDIPQSMLGYFVELANKTRSLPVRDVEIGPGTGIDIDHPDFAEIRDLVAAGLAPATPTASPSG